MKTETRIFFGVFDTTAKDDVTTTSIPDDTQPFSDFTCITQGTTSILEYGTLEPNFCVLDGTLEDFPNTPNTEKMGIWSLQQSDNKGAFIAPPVITFTFQNYHTSAGLTINTNAKDILVKWHTPLGEVIKSFIVDDNEFVCEQTVENFNKIEITFNSTREPNRFLKFKSIKFGVGYTIKDVISCKIVEEISPTGEEISSNYCDFSFYDEKARFNIADRTSANIALQEGQKVIVQSILNGISMEMGTFYLDEWSNKNAYVLNCKSQDLISLLDNIEFKGGMIDTTVGELLPKIIPYEYTLSNELINIPIKGYLPIMTSREALLQIAFAIGAMVDCSRSDKINIYPFTIKPTKYIRNTEQFLSARISQEKRKTHINANLVKYIIGKDSKELFNEILDGEIILKFNEPVSNLSITGGTIVENNVNYAIIKGTGSNVTLTGIPYIKQEQLISKRIIPQELKITDNVISIDNSYLLNLSNYKKVFENLETYYTNLLDYNYGVILNSTNVGDVVMVDAQERTLKGYVNRQEIDLVNGLKVNVTMLGNIIDLAAETVFCNEIYANEWGVI